MVPVLPSRRGGRPGPPRKPSKNTVALSSPRDIRGGLGARHDAVSRPLTDPQRLGNLHGPHALFSQPQDLLRLRP